MVEWSSCFFSTLPETHREATLHITNACNLNCKHCFYPPTGGKELSFASVKDVVIPQLLKFKVFRVIVSGGEPFLHNDLLNILAELTKNKIRATVSSNGTLIKEYAIKRLSKIGGVSISVSIDGFSNKSHETFRGKDKIFDKVLNSIELLGKYGLLRNLCVTPNKLSNPDEMVEIVEFGIQNGAKGVIMTDLSPFGRGFYSRKELAITEEEYREVINKCKNYEGKIRISYLRFFNIYENPLEPCRALERILGIFPSGDVTVCPYVSFASELLYGTRFHPEFTICNIVRDDIAEKIKNSTFKTKYLSTVPEDCAYCDLKNTCGKGCFAIRMLYGRDYLCPKKNL